MVRVPNRLPRKKKTTRPTAHEKKRTVLGEKRKGVLRLGCGAMSLVQEREGN